MDRDQTGTFTLVEPLTEQESAVLHLLAEGLTNREIAGRLHLSASTVKWYVRQLNSKLHTRNRDEIVEQAYALGLIRETAGASGYSHNLPVQTTPFVGRAAYLIELRHLLAHDKVRLVTILAPGGMGKTRLALEIARQQLEHYEDGVYFVDLAPLRSPEGAVTAEADAAHYARRLITGAVAQAVDFQYHAGSRSREEQILNFLAGHQILLVLDNFEHLLAGATFVAEMLQAAPRLNIVVTSRERLNLMGETIYTLSGMELPDREEPEDALTSDSVQLFLQAARRVQPDFTVDQTNLEAVVDICHLTEGLPLALLLAASWMDVLPPDEIAAEIRKNIDFLETELRDVPDRQRSVRSVFESAWERLGEAEREIFMRLAVFRGRFTREAAETIAGASLRGLKNLVSKAMISQAADGHYRLHRLLGQFAEEKLSRTPHVEAVEAAHRAYYAAFASEWGRALQAGRQLEGLRHLGNARDNISAAFYSAARHRDLAAINQLIDAWYFFEIRCLWREAIDLYDMAASSIEDRLTRARIASYEAMFAFRLGQSEKALRLAQEGYDGLKDADAGAELAVPLNALGVMAAFRGDFDEAAQRFQEAAAIAEQHQDIGRLATELGNLSVVHEHRGELEQARTYLERQLALATEIGDYMNITLVYANLGEIYTACGRTEEAIACCHKCIEFAGRIGQQHLSAVAIGLIGQNTYLQGNYEEARKILLRSLERNQRMGNVQHMVRNLITLGDIALAEDELDQAGHSYHRVLELLAQPGYRDNRLLVLVHVARYLARVGQPARAAAVAAFVDAYHATRYDKQDAAQALLAELEQELPAQDFAAARARGQAMHPDDLLALLLAELA